MIFAFLFYRYFLLIGLLRPNISTMGLATKIDEYVPIITPNIMASEKSWMTSPPKKNSAADERRTVVEVMIVLERTSLTLKFITETMGSLCRSRKFSLILSKKTTVSVSQYP